MKSIHLLLRVLTILLGALVSIPGWSVNSYPSDIDAAAKSLYGATATFKYSCEACHVSGRSVAGGTNFMKDYYNTAVGLNLIPAGLSAAQVQAVINAMAALDSDGDKATTSQELIAGTNPADAASFPVVAACIRGIPTVSLNPQSQSGFAGETLTYKVSILNTDSAACASSVISLNAMISTYLSGKLAVNSVTLNPGQSSTVDLTLMSALNAPVGSHAFSVQTSDAIVSLHSVSVNGSYQVKPAADVKAPTVPLNLSFVKEKNAYIVSWTASTDDTAVAKYRIYVNGVLKTESVTTSAKIRLRRGTNLIQVSAVDSSGNESAMSAALMIVK